MDHSPFPIIIGLILFTLAISAAPGLLPPMYEWVLLILVGIGAFVYAVAPVIAMGRMVRAARVNFAWGVIAVFMQLMLWSFLLWLASVVFDMDLTRNAPDISTFKRLLDPSNIKFDQPWLLLGGAAIYILINSLVYNAVLMASHLQAVAICIGTDILRGGLFALLAWMLTVWK